MSCGSFGWVLWPGDAKTAAPFVVFQNVPEKPGKKWPVTVHLLAFNVGFMGFNGSVAQNPFTLWSPLLLVTAVITIQHALKPQDAQVWSEYGSGRFTVGHLRQTGALRRPSKLPWTVIPISYRCSSLSRGRKSFRSEFNKAGKRWTGDQNRPRG